MLTAVLRASYPEYLVPEREAVLRLCAFGPLQLQGADGPARSLLRQPKRVALLAYLVLARPRGYHRRDSLVALFWPELDQAAARNALSQALYVLRRSLPDGVIRSRGGEEVMVDPARVGSDVEVFRVALEEARWADALALYRGDFLAGFHVPGAPGFDLWLDGERERLRELAAGAAWELAHDRIAAGALVDAERAAQRALLLVPTDESPVRRFILALARAGDRAGALRFYEKFAVILARELEVSPAPETEAAAAALRSGEALAATAGGSDAARPAPAAVGHPAADRVRAGDAAGAAAGADGHASGRGSRRAPPAGLVRTGRRRRWGVPLSLVVVVLVTATLGPLLGWLRFDRSGGPGTLIGEGRASWHDRVVVADLVGTVDASLGRIAAEWLRVELDQSDIVRVVSPEAIGSALRRMQRDPSLPLDETTAREIAARDGYPLVVAGEIEALDDHYLLTIRLGSAEGEILARYHEAARSELELLRTVERLGARVRQRIGESRSSIRRTPPLSRVTTPSLEALRLYVDAVRLRDREGRPRDAIPLLERAIAIDPQFASAQRKLALTLNNLGVRLARRTEVAEAAWANRDRLTEYERLLVEGAWLFEQALADSTADECQLYLPKYEIHEAYHRRHPEDARAWDLYAWHLERVGRGEEAEEWYRRRIALGDASAVAYADLYQHQSVSGKREAAAETLEALRRRFGETSDYLRWRAAAALRAGDLAGADSLFTTLAARFVEDPETAAALARYHALRGRVTAAEAAYATAIRRLDQDGYHELAAQVVSGLALIRLVAWADTAAALEAARSAMGRAARAPLAGRTWIEIGMTFALAGDVAAAEAVVDTLVARRHGGWSRVRGALRGAIAAAAGDPDRALDLLASAQLGCVPASSPRLIPWDAVVAPRSREAADRADSAIAAHERYLAMSANLPDPTRLDAIFLVDTLGRLGHLYAACGDSARATAVFQRVATLWADADPALRARVLPFPERPPAATGGS